MLGGGEQDVLNNGMMMFVPAPGHSVGCQVRVVNLPMNDWIVLGGDLYYASIDRELQRVPLK